MKNSREHFAKLRPLKQLCRLPIVRIDVNNKEELRCLITDYVLHRFETNGSGLKKFKSKRIKYPSFVLRVNVNGVEREIAFGFSDILNKYLAFEKKNIYRDERIEPLVVDILNFLDEIDEKTKNIIFQIEPYSKLKTEEEVLNLIIEKHHKDKQKLLCSQELNSMRRKIVAKHTRVSYIDIEDQLKKK